MNDKQRRLRAAARVLSNTLIKVIQTLIRCLALEQRRRIGVIVQFRQQYVKVAINHTTAAAHTFRATVVTNKPNGSTVFTLVDTGSIGAKGVVEQTCQVVIFDANGGQVVD